MQIRKVKREDLPSLKKVLDLIELFPSEMLDKLIHGFFEQPDSNEIWFTAIHNEKPISIGYCAPERMTEGTYNLYAIGVHPEHQGIGVGKEMMNYIEREVTNLKGRILIVETSGKPEFELTREFYHKCSYIQQAIIPEFYAEGDDKVVFWKKIQ